MPLFLVITENKTWNYHAVDSANAEEARQDVFKHKGNSLGYVDSVSDDAETEVKGPYATKEEMIKTENLESLS
jgi:hypothetical protein